MSRDKTKATRERLTRAYKRTVIADLMSHFKNYYPMLTKKQIRRIFSHAYQMLRERKAR